jgi:hypothetical protein
MCDLHMFMYVHFLRMQAVEGTAVTQHGRCGCFPAVQMP